MDIKLSQVNVMEKDIEDWLYANPNDIRHAIDALSFEWIERQYRVPSGIIDLIGYGRTSTETPCVWVVEVKNVPASADAVCQVLRYRGDVSRVVQLICRKHGVYSYWHPHIFVRAILVAPGGISNQLLSACNAADVDVHNFSVNLSLDISGRWAFKPKAANKHFDDINKLSKGAEWAKVNSALKGIKQAESEDYDVAAEFEEAIKNATK